MLAVEPVVPDVEPVVVWPVVAEAVPEVEPEVMDSVVPPLLAPWLLPPLVAACVLPLVEEWLVDSVPPQAANASTPRTAQTNESFFMGVLRPTGARLSQTQPVRVNAGNGAWAFLSRLLMARPGPRPSPVRYALVGCGDGTVNQKVLPLEGPAWMPISPPCASTISLEM